MFPSKAVAAAIQGHRERLANTLVLELRPGRVDPVEINAGPRIDPEEMYQVFNMGIGMVAIVSPRDTAKVMSMLKAKQIGRIERGSGKTQLL